MGSILLLSTVLLNDTVVEVCHLERVCRRPFLGFCTCLDGINVGFFPSVLFLEEYRYVGSLQHCCVVACQLGAWMGTIIKER